MKPDNKLEEIQLELINPRLLHEFSFRGHKIPFRMHKSILDYFNHRKMPGPFLEMVLHNDLVHAAQMADDENIELLHVYASFLYSHAPMIAYGSKEKVKWFLESYETRPFKHQDPQ